MYIDYDAETYPFDGAFYRPTIDTNKPLLEQKEEKIVVLSTKCDITEGGIKNTKFLSASFSIYFPFDMTLPFPVRKGDIFEGSMFGMEVNGKVLGVFPSELGGAVAYLEDRDVEDEN